MSYLITGDAFKEDRVSERTYGLPVTSANHTAAYSGIEDTPEPMCNNVSTMRLEAINPYCRNLVAVSESFLVYTVKKTKLRAIHTASTLMALLVSHDSPIIDLKFSQVDQSILCSVGDSQGEDSQATSKVIIWQLQHAEMLTSEILAEFSFPAAMVQSHPKIAHVFAVAKGRYVGIVSGSQKGGAASWDDLPLHTIMPANITDISFSIDGTMLVVVSSTNGQSDIVFLTLPESEDLALGRGRFIKVQKRLHAETVWSDILSVMCLPCGIFTASRLPTAADSATRTVQLQLLSMDSGSGYLDIVQSIKVTLPLDPAASKIESSNDIKLSFKNCFVDDVKYVVLCHRSCPVLACLAVNLKKSTLPLCHLIFFDLRSPAFSVDTTSIGGTSRHSNEEGEHLEIACFQVQDRKNNVNQYHLKCSSLYNRESMESESQENLSDIIQKFSGQTSFDSPQKSVPITSVLHQEFSSNFPAAYSAQGLVHIPAPPSVTVTQPVFEPVATSTIQELAWSEIEIKGSFDEDSRNHSPRSGPSSVPQETPHELAPLPEILRANVTQGKSIMSMLSKLKATKLPALAVTEPVSVPVVPASVPVSVPVSVPSPIVVPTPVPVIVAPLAVIPAPAAVTPSPTVVTPRTDIALDPVLASPPPAGIARLMSGIYETLFTDVTPPAEVTVTVPDVVSPAPASVLVPPIPVSELFEVAEEEEEDDWAEASAAVAVTARRSPTNAPKLVGRDALDLALQRSVPLPTPVPALVPPKAATPKAVSAVDVSLHEKVNDLTRGMYSLVECVSDARASASNTNDRVAKLATSLSASTYEKDQQEKVYLNTTLKALKADLLGEMKSLLESSNAKAQRDQLTMKNEAAALATAQSKEVILAVTKNMKAMVDVEVKQAVEEMLKGSAWRDQLLAQMMDTMSTEFTPVITQKVKETLKETVRDTVKSALASSFRTAFESSLLPAFQAGTDRMFAQVQASFDQGMKGLADQNRVSRECSDECTIEMSKEVAALRSTVIILEAKIDELIDRPNTVSAVGASEVSSPLPDPVALLQAGNVLEAVECALELRDISKLVTLLGFMTPTQLVINCNKLVQLCTAHQLAEDLTFKPPQEGISKRLEWLNSLIFGLLFSGQSQDTSAVQHLKPVFADIGKFLCAAESSIISQIGQLVSTPDNVTAYMPTAVDFKFLTISVSGVNFDSADKSGKV